MSSLQHFEQLGKHFFRLIKSRMRLFKLELNLAAVSIIPFIISGIFLLLLTSSAWITALALASYFIYTLTQDLLISLASVLLINLVLIIFLVYHLKQMLQQMQFTRTRKHFKKLTQDVQHAKQQQLETTN